MTQGEAVPTEQLLGARTQHPGLQHRSAGHGVHRDQPVQAGQVESDHPGEAVPTSGQAAHDRRPTPERHQGDPLLAAPRQQRGDLGVVGRDDDGIRGVPGVAVAHLQQVGGRLAAGVPHAGLVVGVHVLGADGPDEPGDVLRRQARGRDADVAQRRDGPLGGRAEGELDQVTGCVGEGVGQRRVAPAGPVHRCRHVLQCDT